MMNIVNKKDEAFKNLPYGTKASLAEVEYQLGFIPNIFTILANSELSLTAFMALNQSFSESNFTAEERELIQLVVSLHNECDYCVAGHTAFIAMNALPLEIVDALKTHQPLASDKLQNLRLVCECLLSGKGKLSNKEISQFIASGYREQQLLEVIIGVSLKMLTNYVARLTDLDIDDEFIDAISSHSKVA